MIHKFLSDLGGIGLFGVISICVFFTVFVGALIFAARLRTPHVREMAMLPLDDGTKAPVTIVLETRQLDRFKSTRVVIGGCTFNTPHACATKTNTNQKSEGRSRQ